MSTVAATFVTDLSLWGLLALSALCGAVIAGGGALLLARLARRGHANGNDGDLVAGVADRRAFVERLDADWRSAREGLGDFGLLVIDIDAFGEINEVYGRSVGDRVLVEVAERIRTRVRRDDFVARVDADEFAVICHGAGAEELEATRRNLEAYVNFASSAPVMLSIGVASPSVLDDSSLDVLDRSRRSLAERREERPARVVNDALAALLMPR